MTIEFSKAYFTMGGWARVWIGDLNPFWSMKEDKAKQLADSINAALEAHPEIKRLREIERAAKGFITHGMAIGGTHYNILKKTLESVPERGGSGGGGK